MADQKITQLTALTTPVAADLLAIVDDVAGTPETKKITLSDLASFFGEVTVSGTPTPGDVAVFLDASTLIGNSNFAWNESIFTLTLDTAGRLELNETNASPTLSGPTYAILWVDNATTPNQLIFTDGAANDNVLVKATGTPVDNQLAVWTASNTIEGDAALTFDGVDTLLLGTDGVLALDERTTAASSTAAQGRFWVRDDAPNVPVFTDDDGTDFVLTGGNATTITVADESVDTTCFPLFVTAATGVLGPKTNAATLTFDSSTGEFVSTNLTVIDTGLTDSTNFNHDGTDFNIAMTNTTNANWSGITSLLLTGTNPAFRSHGGTGSASIQLHGDLAAHVDFSLDGTGGTDFEARLRYFTGQLRLQPFSSTVDFVLDAGDLVLTSGSGDIQDGNLTITKASGSDCLVHIEADPANSDEASNAILELSQDGGAVVGTFELTETDNLIALTRGATFATRSTVISYPFDSDTVTLAGGVNVNASLVIFDSTTTDSADFNHDGTDFNTAFTTTTDWNITGISSIQAPAVGAHFDALSSTSILLDQDNDATTPTLAFGNGDTGFYESSDNVIAIAVSGAGRFSIDASNVQSETSGGFVLSRTAGSTTSPVFRFRLDTDTGMGRGTADQLSLIAGGVEMLRLSETGTSTTDQLIIAPAAIIGAAATPALAFGDGDSGLFESADDTLNIAIAGTSVVSIDAADMTVGLRIVPTAITNPTESVVAANAITAAESGTTFFLNLAGGFTSTLPAPAAGLKYTFIIGTAPTTAYLVTTNGAAAIIQGLDIDIAGTAAMTNVTTVTFVASTSLVGDSLALESDGTNWYGNAQSAASGGVTTA